MPGRRHSQRSEQSSRGRLFSGRYKRRSYRLPAHSAVHPVVHIAVYTVGPVWQGSHADEDNLLASCYRSVFKVAAKRELHSPAFASLSAVRLTLRAAQITLQEPVREIWTGLRANFQLEWTKAVCFSDGNLSVYQDALQTEAR